METQLINLFQEILESKDLEKVKPLILNFCAENGIPIEDSEDVEDIEDIEDVDYYPTMIDDGEWDIYYRDYFK